MLKIDAEQRSMPDIDPQKVCFVAEKAREAQSEEDGSLADASSPSDSSAYAAIRSEVEQFIDGLDLDEQCALVALAWIGRGDFPPEQWRDAVALAAERRDHTTSGYLLGLPLLPDYLEEALAAYGCSCQDFGPSV